MSVTRLGPDALGGLPAAVGRPRYDRTRLRDGVLHLGLGAFHRAHQAVYTDAILDRDPRWGIVGVAMRSRDVPDRLAPQAGLYTVLERDTSVATVRVVGAVRRALHAPTQFGDIVRAFAHPDTHVVSLTVTEKGYCLQPATGRLDRAHPDLAADLARPEAPRTAIGLLVAGLGVRELAGGQPLTVVCCDNLRANGRTLAAAVREYAAAVDARLLDWLDSSVRFPCTMVDRIVPATRPADLDEVERRIGCRDAAAVACEPFSQWVIEDDFAGPRPPWEKAGAQLVQDVAPFEDMKLRLVNAANSGLAYLGLLAGLAHIADAVRVPAFARCVDRLMHEDAAPTLAVPTGVDVDAYAGRVLERFANPALGHACAQVATDGSQKLPQRLLSTARERLAAGARCDHVALVVAAWMRHLGGRDDQGQPIALNDPLAAGLTAALQSAGPGAAAAVRALLAVREVFGDDLPQRPEFVAAVTTWYSTLAALGARQALAQAYR